MIDKYIVKLGDTKEPMIFNISRDSEKVNLTGCVVRFLMIDSKKGDIIVEELATIVDAVNGVVSYTFKDKDVSHRGIHQCEIEVDFPDFRKETFPKNRPITIIVTDSLRRRIDKKSIDGSQFDNINVDSVIDGGNF